MYRFVLVMGIALLFSTTAFADDDSDSEGGYTAFGVRTAVSSSIDVTPKNSSTTTDDGSFPGLTEIHYVVSDEQGYFKVDLSKSLTSYSKTSGTNKNQRDVLAFNLFGGGKFNPFFGLGAGFKCMSENNSWTYTTSSNYTTYRYGGMVGFFSDFFIDDNLVFNASLAPYGGFRYDSNDNSQYTKYGTELGYLMEIGLKYTLAENIAATLSYKSDTYTLSNIDYEEDFKYSPSSPKDTRSRNTSTSTENAVMLGVEFRF